MAYLKPLPYDIVHKNRYAKSLNEKKKVKKEAKLSSISKGGDRRDIFC